VSPPERLESLLALYVERQVAGGDPPDPAELCRDTPELLEPLQELIVKLESVGQRLADSTLEGESIVAWLEARRASSGGGGARTEDAPAPVALDAGRVLSNRYRVRSLLGRGGQGEVWRAEDLKLRVEVALKALRFDRSDASRLAQVRREVRAARSVASPNVCRIFDLVDLEGEELVSMEYVDGSTLYDVLRERGPLPLEEALEIASQLLAGLEAVHAAGLVHRDVKPENVMVTRTGRVVVMDLGLAKVSAGSSRGSISGTPAYMAPEQAAGEPVDARADVFSAGVLLAEMVHPGGIASRESRRSVWEAVRRDPVVLSETPWRPVLEHALARDPDDRFPSVRELARALERVTLKGSARDASPYPGLARFEEDDARYFFGREAETEALWKRLVGPSRLLAVAGPSGAGKSSFLHAGLLAAKPEGWVAIAMTPGGAPSVALGQAIGEALAGDRAAAGKLVRFHEPDVAVELVRAWRARHREALLVVDQFEELFTQNPEATQRRFAELLGRLPLEADVHVVLGLRDDFLLACQLHEPLAPIFSELTPLQAPAGAALRRALTQPALQCGFRFEDDTLVDEMLAEVEGERGALPLLAFAAASLWERRERTEGLLTRSSYRAIGGVAGALAGHAEATLERIGVERRPLVRDLFRNLVTPQGTRASRRVEELVSVAEDRDAAREVVATLVDARLLTEYETPAKDEAEEPEQRVEIVHESLLNAWPRLVRWRTQDADAAQMREQVRQAAQVWDEKGRPEELLWTGASYREFYVWRERYPGRLTEVEQEFARAMTLLAERRRRRRRVAAAVAFTALAAVAITVSVLWTRAERAHREAHQEALRAEASKLVALGRGYLRPLPKQTFPSEALAYAIAALETHDDAEGRELALRALWAGPTAYVLGGKRGAVAFSPDGRWLAFDGGDHIELWERGAPSPRRVGDARDITIRLALSPSGDHLLRGALCDWKPSDCPFEFTAWRLRDGTQIDSWSRPRRDDRLYAPFAEIVDGGFARAVATPDEIRWETREFGDDSWRTVTQIAARGASRVRFSVDGGVAVYQSGTSCFAARRGPLEDWSVSTIECPDARAGGPVGWALSADGSQLATTFEDGTATVTSLESRHPPRRLAGAPHPTDLAFDRAGRSLLVAIRQGSFERWDLAAPDGVLPWTLQLHGDWMEGWHVAPGPPDWVAASGIPFGNRLWPLPAQLPQIFAGPEKSSLLTIFSPDTRYLFSTTADGKVIRWPLSPEAGEPTTLLDNGENFTDLSISPDGETLLLAGTTSIWALSTSTGEARVLRDFHFRTFAVTFDAAGRRAATNWWDEEQDVGFIHIWDFETGAETTLGPTDLEETSNVFRMRFTPDGSGIVTAGDSGLALWPTGGGPPRSLGRGFSASFSRVSSKLYTAWASFSGKPGKVAVVDLETGAVTPIPSHGGRAIWTIVDPQEKFLITSGFDGIIRVGPVTGEEPHLLIGHQNAVTSLALSPDGRFLASSGSDGTVRVWPMPDLSRPPLQTLPHDELLARLESFTNLRVVADPDSASGYRVEAGPFRGWGELPAW